MERIFSLPVQFEVRRKSVYPVYRGLLRLQGGKRGGKSVYYVYTVHSFQAISNRLATANLIGEVAWYKLITKSSLLNLSLSHSEFRLSKVSILPSCL